MAEVASSTGPSRSVVMLLTNDFVSDPRVEKEALALSDAGWVVTVLAWDRSQSHPATERRGPIRIERLGPAAPYGGGPKSLLKFREFWRRAAIRTQQLAPDVVHCHDLDTASAAMEVRRRTGTRGPHVVLDFHELYRESKMVPQSGIVGTLAAVAVRRVERDAIAAASVVIVANPGTVDSYDDYSARDKMVLVENAPDLDRFSPRPTLTEPSSAFRVCFIGQKRYTQGLYTLMEAVQRDDRLHALLAGGGVAETEIAEAATRFERVEVVGRLRIEEIPAHYEQCDCVYAAYDAKFGNVRTLFPVKVMEGMACAVPVLVSRGTWIADYVEEHGIGLAIDEADVDEVTAALSRLASDPKLCEDMGRRGRNIVEAGLNWKAASSRLIAAYDALAPRG